MHVTKFSETLINTFLDLFLFIRFFLTATVLNLKIMYVCILTSQRIEQQLRIVY